MIKFSIVMCSRARPSILEQNITSIKLLADEPESVEIIIGADDDDLVTRQTVEELQKQFSNIHLIVRPRFKNLHKFHNILTVQSIGKYLLILNDDSLLEEVSWDTNFEKQIESTLAIYQDRVGYFGLTSNSTDRTGDYSEFFLITREAFTALGFLLFEETESWGCDVLINRIYSSVSRLFKLQTERPIRHLLHEHGTVPNDNRTFMEGVFKDQYGQDWGEAVRKMQEHVNSIDITPYSTRLLDKIKGIKV